MELFCIKIEINNRREVRNKSCGNAFFLSDGVAEFCTIFSPAEVFWGGEEVSNWLIGGGHRMGIAERSGKGKQMKE